MTELKDGEFAVYRDVEGTFVLVPHTQLIEHFAAAEARGENKVVLRAIEDTEAGAGWLFHNPDTGVEWSEHHPIESGEVPDAENVRLCTASELKPFLQQICAERDAAALTRSPDSELVEALRQIANPSRWSTSAAIDSQAANDLGQCVAEMQRIARGALSALQLPGGE